MARFTISGTQTGYWGQLPLTNKPARFDEIVIITLRNGKVVHQSGVVDNLSALRQLGVMPAPRAGGASTGKQSAPQQRSIGPEDEDRAGPEAPTQK